MRRKNKNKAMTEDTHSILTPESPAHEAFTDAVAAVGRRFLDAVG